ncbi:MAG: ABC transporter permease [Sulfitobacter sp.]|jgi:ABC-type polysaccharide/polyol phosphate export permease|uniref:ABC transporter permease n=1 Tax=Sulfitobacter sp. TaxID=1903071 RepID=UPI000C10A7A0|nr:ABC transporter permease [Roseobacter sp.]MBV49216.1 ABC transporter permease [Roseobacter sp.]PHR09798.1 MAG: ABC transporter permease [Sulfitobacter sp.]
MFQPRRTTRGNMTSALNMAELVYHSVVRSVRKQHNNAFAAIGINILQAVIFVGVFYVMFTILGMRGSSIRGDFVIYIMTGIFLFMMHTKTVTAVAAAEGPASAMMQHAPMTTMIALAAAALGSLYIQMLSLIMIMSIYHLAFNPVVIDDPSGVFFMMMIAWFTGVAVGMVLLAIKPWAPSFTQIFTSLYQRANMVASGKMFLANSLPTFMIAMFDWNPLFHIIDQARGYAFINYNPRYSNWEYAVWVGVVLMVIGLMGEFYTRKHASASWSARR